jgi:hypothetical protein
MRTTLDLDDALLDAARDAAHRTRRSIGAVISEWAKRGSAPVRVEKSSRRQSRLPTFPVRPGSPPIDLAVEQQLLDDEP